MQLVKRKEKTIQPPSPEDEPLTNLEAVLTAIGLAWIPATGSPLELLYLAVLTENGPAYYISAQATFSVLTSPLKATTQSWQLLIIIIGRRFGDNQVWEIINRVNFL